MTQNNLMPRAILIPLLFILVILKSPGLLASSPESSRTIVHLLDYIALDYSMAISKGEVISQMEYAEMQEFGVTVEELTREITFENVRDSVTVFENIAKLREGIENKINQDAIASLAFAVKADIIRITGIKVSPTAWPDLKIGRQLYQEHCSACHGEEGDGNGMLAEGLTPEPTSFRDEKMLGISPFQAFNTIRLGVPGTSMRAFHELSDQEAWELSFYVNSLYYEGDVAQEDIAANFARASLSLEEVASLSDTDLKNKLSGTEEEREEQLASLRLYSEEARAGKFLRLADRYVEEAVTHFNNGNPKAARTRALQAYLEGIEPVEMQLRASDPRFTIELENKMAALRQAIEGGSAEQVVAKAGIAREGIAKASSILDSNDFSFWLSFFLSASVILREGIEAFLIIVTMLGIIRAAKTPWAAKWVHFGWIVAVAVGVAGWFFADMLIAMGGAEREILEGSIALFACCMLLYIGFWLHSKSEIGKWNAFVKDKVHKVLHGNNMLALSFFSFIVVFREAFESVLFLSALNLEVEPANKPAIGFGVLVAFIAVLILSWMMLKYTAKLPIVKLFKFSSTIIAILAVILVGKGIHAIQETGIFSITAFPLNLRVDFLGIYPTVETLMSQVVVLGVIMVLWRLGKKPPVTPAVEEKAKV